MGPPGGGRNIITDRLLTKFNVINMTFPTEKQITRIYGTMLNQHLSEFHSEVKGICMYIKWNWLCLIDNYIKWDISSSVLANDITLASIKLYNHVIQKMLPTPTKMHYLFNLRDISKVKSLEVKNWQTRTRHEGRNDADTKIAIDPPTGFPRATAQP